MTAHKHAEMIKAKADDMELVVFVKDINSGQWLKLDNQDVLPAFYEHYEYFLCHPKHEKECLHWLNGGEVEDDVIGKFTALISKDNYGDWHSGSVFMDGSRALRIKPRKEKRWILYSENPLSMQVFSDEKTCDLTLAGQSSSERKQKIQIEVEV